MRPKQENNEDIEKELTEIVSQTTDTADRLRRRQTVRAASELLKNIDNMMRSNMLQKL